MKISCDIIQDLIPLVNDGVASQESEKLVLEHCKECEECHSLLESKPPFNEMQLNQKWKKKLRMTILAVMVFIILIACSFTQTIDQFQNFILIPLVGILGYGLLKKKVYIVYLMIPVIQILMNLLFQETHWSILFYIPIYWLLLTIGIAIYVCFHYAFKGGKSDEG